MSKYQKRLASLNKSVYISKKSPKVSEKDLNLQLFPIRKQNERLMTKGNQSSSGSSRQNSSAASSERSIAPTYVKFYKYEHMREKLNKQGMKDRLRAKLRKRIKVREDDD